MNHLKRMLAKHGAWSMYRLGYPGGTMWATEARGEDLGYMRKLEAACLQAVYDEANLGRWAALANFTRNTEAI